MNTAVSLLLPKVSNVTFVLEHGLAHDAFHVTLPAGDQRPDSERVRELEMKIQVPGRHTGSPFCALLHHPLPLLYIFS